MVAILDVLARITAVAGAFGGVATAFAAVRGDGRRRRRIAHLVAFRENAPSEVAEYIDALHARELAEYAASSMAAKSSSFRLKIGARYLLGINGLINIFGGVAFVDSARLGLNQGSRWVVIAFPIVAGLTAATWGPYLIRRAEWRTRAATLMLSGHSMPEILNYRIPDDRSLGFSTWRAIFATFLCATFGSCAVMALAATVAFALDPHTPVRRIVQAGAATVMAITVCYAAFDPLAKEGSAPKVVEARREWQQKMMGQR